ncbi:hypothetical protein M422DRAFT_242002 [Sphaerobolus stellatus SS14]|nr:hypothetical protein M422DRAFT_242002 [Sphaerobolus stellatus SS14]
MPGRALSKKAQKQKKRQDSDAQMTLAIEAYKVELAGPDGKKLGLWKVTAQYGVSHATLSRLVNGGASISTFNLSKRVLTEVEEEKLLEYMVNSANRGFPLAHKHIRQYANMLLKNRPKHTQGTVGKNWVDCFIERHNDQLQTHWSKPLDTA